MIHLLPSPPLSERRRYCDARRHAVCVCHISVSGEGNALYPVLSSLHSAKYSVISLLHAKIIGGTTQDLVSVSVYSFHSK